MATLTALLALCDWGGITVNHDDVIKWKHFQRDWPFVRGIHRSPVISPHKCQWPAFSAWLAICAGNSRVTGEFPAQRPVTRSFDVFFDLRLKKRLSKQSLGWWFETLSDHYDVTLMAVDSPHKGPVMWKVFPWHNISWFDVVWDKTSIGLSGMPRMIPHWIQPHQ